MDKVGELNYKC